MKNVYRWVFVVLMIGICLACGVFRQRPHYTQLTADGIPLYPNSQQVVRTPNPYDIAAIRRLGEDGVPLSLQTVLTFRSPDTLPLITQFYQNAWEQQGFKCESGPSLVCRRIQSSFIFEAYGEELRVMMTAATVVITLYRFMSFE